MLESIIFGILGGFTVILLVSLVVALLSVLFFE